MLLALTMPQLCLADYGNMLHMNARDMLGIGAIVALPTAALCVLVESILPRRLLPVWLTLAALLGALIAIPLALIASKAAPGAAGEWRMLFWLGVPVLATLALRGMVRDGLMRLAAGWVVALAVLALVAAFHPYPDLWMLVVGGAISCLTLWSMAVLTLRARRVAPVPDAVSHPGVNSSNTSVNFIERFAAVRQAVSGAFPPRRAASWLEQRLERLKPAEAGLLWWFVGASALYFGIGAAISAGKLGGGGWLYVEWQYVADLFGLRYPREFRPAHVWWVFGLPWSLFAGSAIWGLAGLFGGFDPGRARILRFAAVVFGSALLVWTASIIAQMAEVNAREEQASGIHR